MKNSYTYFVQYQDVDNTRRMRLSTFLNDCVLNIAGAAADEHGFGIRDLLPRGLSWIITRVTMQLHHLPTHGETLKIETWVERNAHMLSIRNFRFYEQQGNEFVMLGRATSEWAVIDLEKREIVNAFHEALFEAAVDGEVLHDITLQRMPRAATLASFDVVSQAEHTIQYSDIDYNRHCNSVKYVEWMLNTYRREAHTGPFEMTVNYLRELYLGERMMTKVVQDSQTVYYQQFRPSGELCCQAMIRYLNTP